MTTMTSKRHLAQLPKVYTKSLQQSGLVTSLLTYPEPDMQGDYVAPDGGDWSLHDTELGRVVNYDHGTPIGRAVDRDGSYGVTMQVMEIGGTNYRLPLGVTTFFETAQDANGLVKPGKQTANALKVAEQARRLIEDGVVTGVSLEFQPDQRFPKSMRQRGDSPLEDRPAFHFAKWVGLGWAHTLMPVNPNAQVLLPDAVIEKSIRYAHLGRVGAASFAEPIRKSFAPFLQIKRPATVQGNWRKSMYENEDESPDNMTPADMPTPDDGQKLKATPAAIHDIVAMLTDAAQQAESHMEEAEHEGGLQLIQMAIEQLRQMSASLSQAAAELFPEAGFGAPEGAEADSGQLPVTDDGAVMSKAFRKGYPKRFRAADFRPTSPAPEGYTLLKTSEFQRLKSLLKNLSKN
jgi:hypothetical protein